MTTLPAGIFSSRYDLRGKGWINSLTPEDKQALIAVGCEASDYGKLGGKARASTARRDHRGRFASGTGPIPAPQTIAEREAEMMVIWGY